MKTKTKHQGLYLKSYKNHKQAILALEDLLENGFKKEDFTLIGKSDKSEEEFQVEQSHDSFAKASIISGVSVGTITGVLTGVGVFAIPGFGFLYGAGALVGALAGLEVGVLAGGVGAALSALGLKEEEIKSYEDQIHDGEYIIFYSGDHAHYDKALSIVN